MAPQGLSRDMACAAGAPFRNSRSKYMPSALNPPRPCARLPFTATKDQPDSG